MKKLVSIGREVCKVCKETTLHDYGNHIRRDGSVVPYKQCFRCHLMTMEGEVKNETDTC